MWPSLLSTLAAIAFLAASGPAWAHVADRAATTIPAETIGTVAPSATPTLPVAVDPALTEAAASPAVFPLVLLLGLTASLLAASRSRRTAVTGLIILLAVFAFESSVHSVHHLGEPREQVRCVVESISSNLSYLTGESIDAHGVPDRADVTTNLEPLAHPQRPLSPQRGRAPPFSA